MKFKFHHNTLIIIIIAVITALFLTILIVSTYCCLRRRRRKGGEESGRKDLERSRDSKIGEGLEKNRSSGEYFMRFEGGENLSVEEILDAPGEVIGKSSYGTLYRAYLLHSNWFALLRFLRPTCSVSGEDDVLREVEVLGGVRHPNLVPLCAFYGGARGEKLMVHPFYRGGNLADFIRDGNVDAHKWPVIRAIALGIARGIYHLHTAFENPVIHGNLKSKNVFLDANHNPYVSDFGLHLLLTPSAGQEMLDASMSNGYKPPELIKMKDASEESDVYSFGVILLELLTGKEPIDKNPPRGHESHLLDEASTAILDDRVDPLFHPGIFSGLTDDERAVVRDRVFKFFQLAMACCAATRLLRPHMKQVVDRLEEIGA
ncbi:putative kinase-like protein TMKL1 [Andrographis paniculata]|uniref:putative kinase-like protein TMKL1 n=1 Tax=Andrographis paniculata TaxID=175694 RepID=UPI0021E8276E|nr:putative kinase-like protein TMKL1 [Andrographis paniculata]